MPTKHVRTEAEKAKRRSKAPPPKRNASGQRVIDGPDTLLRWHREKFHIHRALLLCAMQDPGSNKSKNARCDGRSIAKVCDAMPNTRAVVYRWVDRFRWSERIEGHGADAQAYAIELYRSLYFDKYAKDDLPWIADVVSLPMTTVSRVAPTEEASTEVQRTAAKVVRQLLPPEASPEKQKQIQSALDERRERVLLTNKRIATVAELGIKALQDGVRAAVDPKFAAANGHVKPLRPKLADLPKLQQLLADLQEERQRLEHPELQQGPGAALVKSVRYRLAEETGSSLLAAIADDCREVLALAEGMQAPAMTLADIAEANKGAG